MTATIFDDVDRMTAAIRPLLRGEDEKRSLEVRAIAEGQMIEVRLLGAVQIVGRNSLEHTRAKDDWRLTAAGCLDRLRNRHSMTPPVMYSLEDVYREINLVLLSIFAEALGPLEYDDFLDRMNTADVLALESAAARLKAQNAGMAETLVLAVKACALKPASAPRASKQAKPAGTPWTSDLLKETP